MDTLDFVYYVLFTIFINLSILILFTMLLLFYGMLFYWLKLIDALYTSKLNWAVYVCEENINIKSIEDSIYLFEQYV